MRGESDIPWEALTMQDAKVELFRHEFAADDAWQTLMDTWPEGAQSFLQRHSFIVLKPEAIARRVGGTVLDALAQAGFSPIGFMRFAFERNAGHHVWRYQWNAATLDRLRLATIVNEQSDSMMIVLRADSQHDLPTSLRLWSLKGSAHAERRQPHHLRTVIGMRNRMIGFIHTPDEPADVVRELGILCDEQARKALLKQARLGGNARGELNTALDSLERAAPFHPVDFPTLAKRYSGHPLDRLLHDIRAGKKLALADLDQIMGSFDELDAWDRITIAAEAIVHDREDVEPIINSKAVAEVSSLWAAREVTYAA